MVKPIYRFDVVKDIIAVNEVLSIDDKSANGMQHDQYIDKEMAL